MAELMKAREEGTKVLWIANKDVRFEQRRDWLNMFPEQPAASIPYIPYDEWMKLLWDGRWVTDVPSFRKSLAASLKPVMAVVSGEK
jgi:serine/threonine-protein kinase